MPNFRYLLRLFLTAYNIHGDESGMVLIPAGEFNIGKSTKTAHLKDYFSARCFFKIVKLGVLI